LKSAVNIYNAKYGYSKSKSRIVIDLKKMIFVWYIGTIVCTCVICTGKGVNVHRISVTKSSATQIIFVVQ